MQALIPQKKHLILLGICLILTAFVVQIIWFEESENYRLAIIHKYYKFLSKLSHSKPAKYSIAEFIQESHINKPVMIKGSVFFPNQLLVAERGGVLKKIDTINHAQKIILDLSKELSVLLDGGFYSFDFHPKDSIIAVAYTTLAPKKQITQSIELIPIQNKELRYEYRKNLYKLPSKMHFGGALLFDTQGHLFISVADHTFGDTENYCQNLDNLYGKILRIKVDGLSVKIPTDNPFYNSKNTQKEIWAYGFRNPFRMDFLEDGQKIILGDVGHTNIEEVDLVEAGKNYGWSIKEGQQIFKKIVIKTPLTDPVYGYTHGKEGFSITGGIVYRGNKFPELKNKYIFGDYILGNIWALDLTSKKNKPQLLIANAYGITSFCETQTGDIIWTDYVNSKIYKLINLNESLPVR